SESITNARRIIAAHADASNRGQGVVVVDGKMIENLHVESAWRLVELAEAIETLHKGGY
ncbi:MAG: CoA ester lyase, partial [Alphaproteobacteria bacterium]|nr:CoA ester lyase [Alphaproteobacteria bacterium]